MHVVIDGVDFSYGRRSVLKDVSWRLGPGVTGLLGPNGSGKTTLLKLLVGLARPKRGQIDVGKGTSERKARVGFLPQRFSVAGEMRLLDTVVYAAWLNGVPRQDCLHAGRTALERVGLEDLSERRCRSISGGQRQRLGLAAAIAHDPELLVLDEPTVGLDPAQRLNIRQVVAQIGQERTVLLSTHLIEDITYLCRRVGVLAEQRLIFDGDREELEQIISDNDGDGVLGSDFERAYYALVERLRDTN